MNKRKSLILSVIFILFFLLLPLSGALFYTTNCEAEYVQSVDVWGVTHSIKLSDLRRQQQLIKSLPENLEEALAHVDHVINVLSFEPKKTKRKVSEEEQAKAEAYEDLTAKFQINKDDISHYGSIRERIIYALTYSEYIENLETGTDVLSEGIGALTGDKWVINNIAKCKRDYYGLEIIAPPLLLDYGLNEVLHDHVSDIIALVMVVCVSILFYSLYKNYEFGSTTKGKGIIVGCSMLLAAGVFCIYVVNLGLASYFLKLPKLTLPLQALDSFVYCHYLVTIGAFIIIWLLMKLLFWILLFYIIICCISKEKNKLLCSAAGLFVLAEFVASRYSGENPILVLFREINIFSALTFDRFFNRYLNLNIANNAVDRMNVFLLIFGSLLIGSFVVVRFRLKGLEKNAQNKMMQDFYSEIDLRYQESRRLFHDFHNHLMAIKALNECGDREGTDKYIRELTERLRDSMMPVKTGSKVVDMFLFKKTGQAKEQRVPIEYTVGCSLKNTKIPEFDLCGILGNLLDNGLEALRDLPEEQRTIRLSIQNKNDMLYIACENPYQGERREADGKFITTKTDEKYHGIGLASIQRLCKKYMGNMQISTDNNIFRVEILINDI